MSKMTKKMSEAANRNSEMNGGMLVTPKAGDRFRCENCGMELKLTTDCNCKDASDVEFRCCGQPMEKE